MLENGLHCVKLKDAIYSHDKARRGGQQGSAIHNCAAMLVDSGLVFTVEVELIYLCLDCDFMKHTIYISLL